MIKKLTLLTLLSVTFFRASACDVCGCNMSGLYFGFIPMYKSHFLGLRYSQASFKAFIDNDDFYFQDEYSTDTYRRVELIGRFSISKSVQLRYVLPYMMNEMSGSHQNIRSNGIGDPIVMAYYNPINTENDFTRTFMHSMVIGAGLKLPIGEFDREDSGELVNRNFQLGSGSLDYVLGLNYTIRHQSIGLNVESSYKLNTENKFDYQFGDQWNTSANLFYYIETSQLSILPFAGVYHEQAGKHTSNGIIEGNTGGESWLGTLGVQLFRNKLMLNVQYQTPIRQTFNTDSFATITGKDRFSVSIIQNFSFGSKSKTL